MAADFHELVLADLRALRSAPSGLKNDVSAVRGTMTRLRQDVHALRGDILRQERAFAGLEVDMDRIKARLDLTDAPSDH